MKRSILLRALAMLLGAVTYHFGSTLSAQTLTETLQKQIWTETGHWTSADWESRLPAADQDTVFDGDGATAEALQYGPDGQLQAVTVLAAETTWVPIARSEIVRDSEGHLVAVMSYRWIADAWEQESKAIRTLDASGNVLVFKVMYWEEAGWSIAYQRCTTGDHAPLASTVGL